MASRGFSLGSFSVRDAEKEGPPRIIDAEVFDQLDAPDVKQQAFEWLDERVNTFNDVLNPCVRSSAADYAKSKAERETQVDT